jgi:K+-sensing histidine kinase KdpD
MGLSAGKYLPSISSSAQLWTPTVAPNGIPEKDRKRIFEAFTRLDKSRDKQTGRHGLGLAITQKIMFAHKGSISVTESSLGGARFTLSFCCKTSP